MNTYTMGDTWLSNSTCENDVAVVVYCKLNMS